MDLAPNFSRDGRTSFAVLNDWEIDQVVKDIRAEIEGRDPYDMDGENNGKHGISYEKYGTLTNLDDNLDTYVEAVVKVTRWTTYDEGDYYTPGGEYDDKVEVELYSITATDEDGDSHPLKDEQVARIKARIEREVA